MANLVHRDFENEVASYGDVINTRRPGSFKSFRKTTADEITVQTRTVENVQVPLNQHLHVSFSIQDEDASKSFQELVQIYLLPGMQGIARGVDRVICGQVHRFLGNCVGKLGGLNDSTAKDYLLETREKLNTQLAYPEGRRLVVGPAAETALLKTEMFLSAADRGDGGSALREATLGRVLGFDTYMAQNMPGVYTGLDTPAAAVKNVNGATAAGETEVVLEATGDTPVVGEFVTIVGDMQPRYLTTNSNDVLAVLDSALKYAVNDDAIVTVYKYCDADGGYDAGYAKGIKLDGYTAGKVPQLGQLLAFGTTLATRHTYTIVEAYENPSNASQTIVWLDRPLDKAVADNQDAFPGPAGSFGMAFHRDAIALVTRPLALPPTAMGVQAHVASYNDVVMRVSMQYNIVTQSTIVTLDLLAGVALLDANLGAILLG